MLMAVMMSKICFTRMGARPSDGSSSRRTLGALMSALPMASICCSPPDRVPASWELRSLRIGNRVNTLSFASAISFFIFLRL